MRYAARIYRPLNTRRESIVQLPTERVRAWQRWCRRYVAEAWRAIVARLEHRR